MADINHTVIPNLSITTMDSSAASSPFLTVASNASWTLAGIGAITGSASHSATLTSTGTITSSGVISSSGTVSSTGVISSSATISSTGTVDLRSGRLFSRVTSASGTSLVNNDGEWSITNLSVTSCTIQYRSGNTTYTFRADAASVL